MSVKAQVASQHKVSESERSASLPKTHNTQAMSSSSVRVVCDMELEACAVFLINISISYLPLSVFVSVFRPWNSRVVANQTACVGCDKAGGGKDLRVQFSADLTVNI